MIDRKEIASAWPDGKNYLLNHSAGLPPLNAAEALCDGLFGPWHADDDQVWTHWMAATERYRRALAKVVNHDADMICPQPHVSAGLTQILGSVQDRGRKQLLIAERAFPSLGFVFAMAEREGYEVVMIPRDENTQDADVWARYLTEKVHCVLFTHAHSNTSELHDINALSAVAREHGAISIVDVAQSIGIRKVDARAWNVDFIIGSCLKWLCGGSGAGFLWVHPDRLDACEPKDVGWFSHSDPFEFDIHNFEYAPNALRFWGGTPSVAPALIAAHAIESLLNIGLERIETHNREITTALCSATDARYLVSPAGAGARGGTVVLNAGDGQPALIEQLRKADVQFDVRREGIRISPHFYNSHSAIECVLDCLS